MTAHMPIRIAHPTGLAECIASFESIAAAAEYAEGELIELELHDVGVTFQGMTLSRFSVRFDGGVIETEVRPSAALILFIGWFMTKLPSRAYVTWQDGWPIVTCWPSEDREAEGEPSPITPREPVPAGR